MRLYQLSIFFLLFPLVFSQNLTQLGTQVLARYCPYNGLYGTVEDCNDLTTSFKSGPADAGTPLPALLGVGWDPVKGQIRLPFLSLTYNEGRTVITSSGNTFAIPDQILIMKENVTIPNLNTRTYSTLSDYFNDINLNRTEVTSGVLGMSPSMMQEFINYFDTGNNNIVVSTDYRSAYNLTFNTTPDLLPEVIAAIAYLPEEYDEEIYSLFISYWGTSIVIAGEAGGLAQQSTMIKACFGGVDLADNAILYLLKTTDPSQYQHSSFSADFVEYSSAQTMDIFGGNPIYVCGDSNGEMRGEMSEEVISLMKRTTTTTTHSGSTSSSSSSPSCWTSRMDSFEDYPVLTQVSVIPITAFITDTIKRQNLQTAIDAYYLSEQGNRYGIMEAWNQELEGPKIVYYAPVEDGLWDSNYPGRPVLFTTAQPMTPYSLSANQSVAVGNTMMMISSPYGTCGRDSNGYTIATFNPNGGGSYFHTYSIVKMIQQYGTPVRAGCSIATADVTYGGAILAYYVYCCTMCIPSYTPPYIISSGGGTSVDNYSGLFSCTCPPF